jgi:hypothetical protein
MLTCLGSVLRTRAHLFWDFRFSQSQSPFQFHAVSVSSIAKCVHLYKRHLSTVRARKSDVPFFLCRILAPPKLVGSSGGLSGNEIAGDPANLPTEAQKDPLSSHPSIQKEATLQVERLEDTISVYHGRKPCQYIA